MHNSFSTLVAIVLVWGSGQTFSQTTISTDVNDLRYYYYPSAGQQVEIKYGDLSSLQASNIRAGSPTIVVIDGFMSNVSTPMSVNVKNAYASLGNVNVIVLDWGRLSGSGITLLEAPVSYATVLFNVPQVGARLADFLAFLSSNKQIAFRDIHIVGHSMGAHVAGNTGQAVINNYNDLLGRISGLDPAGPLYDLQLGPTETLHCTDAAFVDAYHTNRGELGIIDDLGTVNVYVNGGSSQPGCSTADLTGFPGYCSHSFSWKFFISAFNNGYVACPCDVLLTCTCTLLCNSSCSNGVVVGPNTSTSAQGTLFVQSGQL